MTNLYITLAVSCAVVCSATAGHTADLASEARVQITQCLSGKVNPDDAERCIDHFTAPCAAGSQELAPMQAIARQEACLLAEAQIWQRLRDRAVKGWRDDTTERQAAVIENAAKESERFAQAKCAVFEDTALYGVTGRTLGAECYRDEMARIAIFLGYALN